MSLITLIGLLVSNENNIDKVPLIKSHVLSLFNLDNDGNKIKENDGTFLVKSKNPLNDFLFFYRINK